MRVLITTDTIGGVWTFTQELATGLLELGTEVALVSFGGGLTCDQSGWCRQMDACWSGSFCWFSNDTPLEWMQENKRALAGATSLLMRLQEDFQPDVLHSNQFCFGALPVGIPKIVTAHSDVLSWAEYCREVPLSGSRWLRQYQSLVRSGLDGADAVVAPTRWMMKALERNFILPAQKLVIPNGRHIEASPQRLRKLQGVTAGRLWDEAKSVATLCDVQCPMPILIAGETQGEQTEAPVLSAMADYLGTLSQTSLLALFRESAIYICTSRYEPFGLAPLEAALCGCAVVANDIPSLREVWGDGALYFIDPDSLSRLLSTLCIDEALLSSAQRRSFARAQRYTRKAMASAYLAAYRELAVLERAMCHVA